MWRLSESTAKPPEIDEVSSKTVVYVRRNFLELLLIDEKETAVGTKWQYEENAIPKADWETYKAVMDTQSATTDLELALCDLYEILTGGGQA